VVAAGAVSVPVVVGFVALGAVVIVARSVRDLAREAWARAPAAPWRSRARIQRGSDAA
jgi:hypothetical protein